VLTDLAIEGGQADPQPAGRFLLVELSLGENGQNVLATRASQGKQQVADMVCRATGAAFRGRETPRGSLTVRRN